MSILTAEDPQIERLVDLCQQLDFPQKLAIAAATIGALYMAHCADINENDALVEGFLEEIGDVETAAALKIAAGLIHQLRTGSLPEPAQFDR